MEQESLLCFISPGYHIKLVVFIWMCLKHVFEERKKKTLAFEIWDFLCEEYKKKYNSAIFPFINDRCCFIVVNIVFHAPWSITCLSHVVIFYIVYIWFHFCKKKKPNISLYISYYFITKQICTEALSHCQQHMFVFFIIIWIIFSLDEEWLDELLSPRLVGEWNILCVSSFIWPPWQ